MTPLPLFPALQGKTKIVLIGTGQSKIKMMVPTSHTSNVRIETFFKL